MSDLVEFVESNREMFIPAIVDNSVKWEAEAQFAIQAFQNNSYLLSTAMKNPDSARNAIINIAAIGITLNPASKLAYLVPRDGKVCLDISYMGLLHLAMDTGSIRWGQCEIVYEKDSFEFCGIGNAPIHRMDPFKDRGNPVGAYCVVKTSDGDYLVEMMKRDDIHGIRNRSVAYKKNTGPWVTDELEMWRKTVIKRASKYWPKVERLDQAIHHLNDSNDEGLQIEGQNKPMIDIDSDKFKIAVESVKNGTATVEKILVKYDLSDKAYITLKEIEDARVQD